MEYGLQIGNLEFPRIREVAQAAEQLGYGAVFVPDHVVPEGPERQFDPHHLSYEAMVQVAVLAEATRKMRVGHLVLCNLFRHPVITAQGLTALDHSSNGRLIAGLGSGWTEREFKMTGIAFPDITTRLRMLDEALTSIRSLWTNEETTLDGEFYKLTDAILWPKPIQKPHPPILLGGGGKGLLRVAAKHADIVNIISDAGKPGYISLANIAKLTDDNFRSKVAFLREEAKRVGRDPQSIQISNVIFQTIITDSPPATQSMAEAMAPMFNTTPEGMIHSPLALIGTPEQCIAELKRRTKVWELSQVVFSYSGDGNLRRLAEEVLPNV